MFKERKEIERIKQILLKNNIKLNNGMSKKEIINAEKFYNCKC